MSIAVQLHTVLVKSRDPHSDYLTQDQTPGFGS
jgi:hypothetical protein